MTFMQFIKQVVPDAKENKDGVVTGSDLTAEQLYQSFVALGCSPQSARCVPVSKNDAVVFFGESEYAGNYFVKTTLDDGKYEFDISSNGKNIDYVYMGDV